MVGAVLSMVTAVLGPAAGAGLLSAFVAVPAAILIPSVPFPVMLLTRTVGVAVAPLSTLAVPLAVPVVFNVTLPASRLIVVAPV